MNGYELIEAAVRRLPVPTRPWPGTGEGAEIGLSLLDTSDRLNHVRRLSEHVFLREHGVVTSTTEIDVSLAWLDDSQMQASDGLNLLHGRAASIPGSLTWIPVARLPKCTAAPLEVVDSDGKRLIRLTQYETSRLVSAALFRLLISILRVHVASRGDDDVYQFLYNVEEARWLVEAAIYSLLVTQGEPFKWNAPSTPGTVSGPSARIKDFALGVLRTCRAELRGFFELLERAFNDYLIVVGVDSDLDDHVLRFESPMNVEVRSSRNVKSVLPRNSAAYRVDYVSQVPPTIRAYHLSVSTSEDLAIDQLYLTTDSERSLASTLSHDLIICADRLESHRNSPLPSEQLKYLEVEVQMVARAASEVVRRREWEARLGDQKVNTHALPCLSQIVHVVSTGEATLLGDSTEFASILQHPFVTPATLRTAATELTSNELGETFSCSPGPPSAAVHAYWRRSPEVRAQRTPLRVVSRCVVRDVSENRPRNMVVYALCMSALVWAIMCLITRGTWPFCRIVDLPSQADALVAVLLLVPGFLYSRLDLGGHNTIAGQLRKSSRWSAMASAAVVVGFAAVIAADASALIIEVAAAIAFSMPALLAFIIILQTHDRDGSRGVGELEPLMWLRAEPQSTPLEVDVEVRSVYAGFERNER